MSNQNGCRTHFADLYKVISDASLDFISSVHRDPAYHENSQQEMNLAIEIVDTAVSRRTAKDAAATLLWIVFKSKSTPQGAARNPPRPRWTMSVELVWRSTVDRATRVPARIWTA